MSSVVSIRTSKSDARPQARVRVRAAHSSPTLSHVRPHSTGCIRSPAYVLVFVAVCVFVSAPPVALLALSSQSSVLRAHSDHPRTRPRRLGSLVYGQLLQVPLVLEELRQGWAGEDDGKDGEKDLYHAGRPRFPRNFARDSILSALLVQDMRRLRSQLLFSARHQGRQANAVSGEEPGKIPHEWPGVQLGARTTHYAACDTSALFIIGVHRLLANRGRGHHGDEAVDGKRGGDDVAGDDGEVDDDDDEHQRLLRHVDLALDYILSHVQGPASGLDGLFAEDPALAGADGFALPVTYWKDSDHHMTCLKTKHDNTDSRRQSAKDHRVVYTLAHAMNLCAVRCAAELLTRRRAELLNLATRMRTGLQTLWDAPKQRFLLAKTAHCNVSALASDSLQALFFLSSRAAGPGTRSAGVGGIDLQAAWTTSIERSSQGLETDIGYFTEAGASVVAGYHTMNVWPFEQALIHAAARKHGLQHAAAVASRMFYQLSLRHPKDQALFPEYWKRSEHTSKTSSPTLSRTLGRTPSLGSIISEPLLWAAAGCSTQQWTIASYVYFARVLSLTCDDDHSLPKRIPVSRLNDDYCDCEDGTDEPHTPACAGWFRCASQGVFVPSSFVSDGIEDCADGSDERSRANQTRQVQALLQCPHCHSADYADFMLGFQPP